MTKKSKLVLGLASMLGVSAGATAVSGFAWFTTTKQANVNVTNIGIYSKSSALDIAFQNADLNTAGSVSSSTLTVNAKSTTAVVEKFNGNGTTTAFTLNQTPFADDDPAITVGGAENTAWSISGKTITFNSAPATGEENIVVTYHPREVLTDVSSVDGQHIYKPTWTASGEGEKATAMPAATDGYLAFTMRLTASGSSPLEVFLNSPAITPATNGAADTAAANISRVAIIEKGDASDTTKLILQNTIGTNNKGISSDNASDGGKNWNYDGVDGYDGWDLSIASPSCVSTVSSELLTTTGSPSKNNLSSAPAHDTAAEKLASNYVCHIDAGGHKDIKVVVWLEGTSYNTNGYAYGAYASETNPINGLFSVSLPLIAF